MGQKVFKTKKGTKTHPEVLKVRRALHDCDGNGQSSKKVTQLQYSSYHIMIRDRNRLLEMRRLFQQYVVDIYCKIETERLSFIRRQQKQLRADSYTFLRDHIMASDGDSYNVGQKVILPATYIGEPR